MTFGWVIRLLAYLSPLLAVLAIIFFVVQLFLRWFEKEDRFSVITNVMAILIFAGAAYGCYIVFEDTGYSFYATAGDFSALGCLLAIAGDVIFSLFERRRERRKERQAIMANRPVIVEEVVRPESGEGSGQ